jgi:predicted murein hydrolase (TIGR00659 family)
MLMAILCILLTIIIYVGVKYVYKLKPIVILSPLLITPIIVICILVHGNIPYSTYNEGGKWLSEMMGPATIALAIPLYKHVDVLKKHALTIIVGTLGGSCVGLLSIIAIARLLPIQISLVAGLMLHSTTTPIAMTVSDQIGGIPSITAVLILLTGLLGMMIGPFVIRTLHIRNEIAQGVLMGTSAHTAGTHKSFELGNLSGAIATISMLLTAFVTLCIVPWLMQHL